MNENITKIKNYQIIEEISSNSYSKLYKSQNINDNYNIVYLKEIKKSSIINEEEFINKCNILLSLNNPNILKYYEFIDGYKNYILVMEYCDENLNNFLNRFDEGLPIDLIKNIFLQINNGLKILQDNNINFKNLKFENILLKYNKKYHNKVEIKLCDFGITEFLPCENYFELNDIDLTNKNIKMNDFYILGIILCKLFNKNFNILKIYEGEKILKTSDKAFNNLIYKLLFQNDEINDWNEYFNHPFFYVNIPFENLSDENFNNSKKLLNENFYNYSFSNSKEQAILLKINNKKNKNKDIQIINTNELKDSIIYIDNIKMEFQKIYNFNPGIHYIKIILTKNLIDCSYMFNTCKYITDIKFINVNSNNVINMELMFYKCYNLKNLDISCFNTSKVKSMYCTFAHCYKLKYLDLTNFDVNKVENMYYMFSNCINLINLDISSFNTNNKDILGHIFDNTNNLQKVKVNKNFFDKIKNYIEENKLEIIN